MADAFLTRLPRRESVLSLERLAIAPRSSTLSVGSSSREIRQVGPKKKNDATKKEESVEATAATTTSAVTDTAGGGTAASPASACITRVTTWAVMVAERGSSSRD